MLLCMHRPHLKLPYLMNREITELYVTNALRTFAVSTIAIFIPVFLLKQGFSMLHVALFVLSHVAIGSFFCHVALGFAARHGVKRSMLLSVPALISFFLCLYNIVAIRGALGDYPTLIVLGVIQALASAFYYMGFHVEFAKFSDADRSAGQLSILNVLATAFSILGPLLGALVITFSSFNTLFVIIMALLFMSMIPLFMSSEVHEPFEFRIKHAINIQQANALPFVAEGIRYVAAETFWPVLLYLLFTELDSIGGIFTISNAIFVLFTLYIGMKTKESNKHRILNWGSFLHSLTLAGRTLLDSISLVAVVQGFGALTWSMVHLPFHAIFYNNSKKRGIAYMIFFREMYLHIGRILIILVFIALLLLTETKLALIMSIMISALGMFFMTRITDEPAPAPQSADR